MSTETGHIVDAGAELRDNIARQLRQGDVKERLLTRWGLALRYPLLFLKFFTYTCDQKDVLNPIKAFPADRPHIKALVRLWQYNRMLAVLKSRQQMCTWLFAALSVWECLARPGRLVMLQSKREEDAIGDWVSGDGPLGRARFILNHLPAREMLLTEKAVPRAQLEANSNKVGFKVRGSTLWAIPQGASIIRQRTASGVLSDEAAFQPEFADAYMAAMPCIRGGGWFVALTTADLTDGGFFKKLWENTMESDA